MSINGGNLFLFHIFNYPFGHHSVDHDDYHLNEIIIVNAYIIIMDNRIILVSLSLSFSLTNSCEFLNESPWAHQLDMRFFFIHLLKPHENNETNEPLETIKSDDVAKWMDFAKLIGHYYNIDHDIWVIYTLTWAWDFERLKNELD